MALRRKVLFVLGVVVAIVLGAGAVRVLPYFTGPAIPAGATRLHIATDGPSLSFGCAAALLEPARVATSGDELLLVALASGNPMRVVWPSGFAAWRADGRAVLADPWGNVVGREGDALEGLGGGVGRDDAFHICPFGIATRPSTPALGRFGGDDLSFGYPGSWGAASFPVVSSFSSVIVYLSTAPLADPCVRTPGSIACVRSAVAGLEPDGVLVEWSRQSFPGWTFDPAKGEPVAVAGRRATLERPVPSDACRAIGGDEEIVVTIDDPIPDQNWTEMQACLRGPSLDAIESQVETMLQTVVWRR